MTASGRDDRSACAVTERRFGILIVTTLAPALDGVETVFLLAATGPAQTVQELNMLRAAVGLPDDQARAAMLNRGVPEFHADTLIEVARAYRSGGAETVTSTVPELTGRPAVELGDFVGRHRDVFG